MGGGAVLRGFGKAIGGVGRVGHGLSSPVQQAAPICSVKPTVSSSPLSSSSSSFSCEQGIRSIDDWELTGDEGGIRNHNEYAHPVDQQPHVRHRVIFGTVPTPEEVIEATSDLRDALNLAINPASSTLSNGTVSSSYSPVNDKVDPVEVSSIHENDGKSTENLVNHLDKQIDQNKDKVLQKSGQFNVVKAFNLLQENPAVQGMVFSLASDEGVWKAVMNNEEVMRFRQSLLKGDPDYSQTDEAADNFSHGEKKGEPEYSQTYEDANNHSHCQKSRFIKAMENMKARVFEFMEKITEICSQFFGFTTDKVFSEKDGEFVRAVRVSSMITIAVLLIIAVKRV